MVGRRKARQREGGRERKREREKERERKRRTERALTNSADGNVPEVDICTGRRWRGSVELASERAVCRYPEQS